MRGRMWLRAAGGAILGAGAWVGWTALLPAVPVPVRFVGAFLILVAGPGAAVAVLVARKADGLERLVVVLASGIVLSAAIAQLLGTLDAEAAFPWIAAAIGGGAITSGALWRRGDQPRVAAGDLAAGLLVATVALAAGAVAYANRLVETPDAMVFYGDYDTYDSSYYAAISAELTHRIPPDSLFRAGRGLGYAYHAQLVLAMVHRFGDVPLFEIYFRYAWPAFLVIMALTVFMLVRRLSSSGPALAACALVLFGSDFSYVAARLRPHYADWDRIIWSTNWLTPGAEILYFNTWTPALAVLALGLWMLERHAADGRLRWLLMSAAAFASLVQFKPFGFAAMMAGLAGAGVFARGDRETRHVLAIVIAASLVFVAPYLYLINATYEDSQAVIRPGLGYLTVLPDRVVTQVGLQRPVGAIATLVGGGSVAVAAVSIVLSLLVYFVAGIGMRWAGVPAVWRSLRNRERGIVWRVMAWAIVAGFAFPLVTVTEPYHQTFHTAHTSLLLLWIFAARQAWDWTRGAAWRRAVVVGLMLLVAAPSTAHFLRLKWTDLRFGAINRDSIAIADRLRQEDFDRTVFLQRYPVGPSFVSVLAERRTVLAWSQYARGSGPLAEEIDRFFKSGAPPQADSGPALRLLARQRVTHLVENVDLDRIHPGVVCRLRLILTTPSLRLYEVPADVERAACGGAEVPTTATAGAGERSSGNARPR